jgi:hypothetical protein
MKSLLASFFTAIDFATVYNRTHMKKHGHLYKCRIMFFIYGNLAMAFFHEFVFQITHPL